MSETASISATVAGRYAQALFELAKSEGKIDALRRDADSLAAALDTSDDLRRMIASPVYSRDDQRAAMGALAGPLGLDGLTANTLALMASKRRLFALPWLVRSLRALIAAELGEVTADVTSASPLSDQQQQAIAQMLQEKFGKGIQLNTAVDDSLIGGLIVKVGSKMIDTSIRAKLASLQNAMKEVG